MNKMGLSKIDSLLTAVGALLAEEGTSASIVVIGGTAILHSGLVVRTTSDVDVIASAIEVDGTRKLVFPLPFPQGLERAVKKVARDFELDETWLNAVSSMQWEQGLPPGLERLVEWHSYGNLEVGFVRREGLIPLKLYAAVDAGPGSVHYQDLIALAPTGQELSEASDWVLTQDTCELFPQIIKEVIEAVHGDIKRNS